VASPRPTLNVSRSPYRVTRPTLALGRYTLALASAALSAAPTAAYSSFCNAGCISAALRAPHYFEGAETLRYQLERR
jgi:hypothetical protein